MALSGRWAAYFLPVSQAPGRDVPLMQAGVDSLMSVHLRNALRASLEVELQVTVMFDHPTIAHLAEHLATALEGAGDAEAAESAESLEATLSELEELSDEEVERRLRKGK